MKLREYIKTLQKPLSQRTLTLLLRDKQLLLGYKKKGFGKNRYLGIGGKKEKDETIKEAARREVQEEINITLVGKLVQTATLNFYFPHVADESWNQQVHVFISRKWKGQPIESDEIRPQWFDQNQLPLNCMWHDGRYWLPLILKGQTLIGDFLFNDALKVIEHKIKQKTY